MAADRELVEEQAHLDQTYAAYDALLDALSVSRRDRQRRRVHRGGARADAARAPARVHRARAGRCTSGGSTATDGDAALRRPPRGRRRATTALLAINWRAPAAEPFYAATAARPARRQPPAPARHRGPRGARVRRRAARRRATRPPHRGDRRGHHAPARRRDAPDHLDDHARAVRADHASSPTARWSSRAARAPARPRSACTARRGCCTPTRRSRARACSSSGRTASFIPYISQVLPSLGEQSVEQRAIDALVSRPHAGRRARATSARRCWAAGAWRRCSRGCCGSRVGAPEDAGARSRSGASPVALDAGRRRRSCIAEARDAAAPTSAARARFRDAARRPARHARCSGARPRAARRIRTTTSSRPSGRAQEYQQLVDRVLAAGRRRRRSSRELFKNRRRLTDAGRRPARPTRRSTLLLAVEPPAEAPRHDARPSSRCSTRRAG